MTQKTARELATELLDWGIGCKTRGERIEQIEQAILSYSSSLQTRLREVEAEASDRKRQYELVKEIQMSLEKELDTWKEVAAENERARVRWMEKSNTLESTNQQLKAENERLTKEINGGVAKALMEESKTPGLIDRVRSLWLRQGELEAENDRIKELINGASLHPETGVSLVDDVRDLVKKREELINKAVAAQGAICRLTAENTRLREALENMIPEYPTDVPTKEEIALAKAALEGTK